MFNLDCLLLTDTRTESPDDFEMGSSDTLLADKNDGNAFFGSIYEGKGEGQNEAMGGNYLHKYGSTIYSRKVDKGEAVNHPSYLNKGEPVCSAFTLQDNPALDYEFLPTNGKNGLLTSSIIPSRTNRDNGSNTIDPRPTQETLQRITSFDYGLDALIHGIQLGFGPQRSFRVALPSVSLSMGPKAEYNGYDLEGLGNASSSPVEIYVPHIEASTKLTENVRNKKDFDSMDSVKKQPKKQTPNIPIGGEHRTLVSDKPIPSSSSKKEAFVTEAQGYMREIEFILNQLCGEFDNDGIFASKPQNLNAIRKPNAADFEALMAGPPSSYCITPFPIFSSSRRNTTKSSTPGRCRSNEDNNVEFISGKGKKMDMEYPVFDDSVYHELFVLPETFSMDQSTVTSMKRKEKMRSRSNSNLKKHLPSSKLSSSPPPVALRDAACLPDFFSNESWGDMEYPSPDGLRHVAGFDMTNFLPVSQSSPGIPGASRSASSISTVQRVGYDNKEGLRDQEERIKDARRRASDNKHGGVRDSRMVVMDNRYGPKSVRSTERRDSGLMRRQEAERKENEDRQARVHAFLEKRRAERARHEKMKRSGAEKVAERVPKVTGRPSTVATNPEKPRSENSSPKKNCYNRKAWVPKNSVKSISASYFEPASPSDPTAVQGVTQSTKSLGQLSGKRENNVRSLVVIYKTEPKLTGQGIVLRLHDDTTLEIRRGRETTRFFEVDECLESHGEKSLYSITLSKLRRIFFSGLNVSMCLAGSESAQLLRWRPLREAMQGIFQDLGGNCELFASFAWIQQGLTQDLLSKSGRMVRTTFDNSPLLKFSLENVGYTKVSDLRQFSKLLARSWEVALFDSRRNYGFIVVTIILKQIKDDNDVVLSSMLVTCGNQSDIYLNSLLKQENNESRNLFGAALGGPCFTVAALTLVEGDQSNIQLMNTERKLASIVNTPGTVGSIRKFLKKAEEELAACGGDDGEAAATAEKREMLTGQIAFAKKALMDPKNFMPKECPEELKRRQEMKQKATLGNMSGGTRNHLRTAAAAVAAQTKREVEVVRGSTNRRSSENDSLKTTTITTASTTSASTGTMKGKTSVGEHSELLPLIDGNKNKKSQPPLENTMKKGLTPFPNHLAESKDQTVKANGSSSSSHGTKVAGVNQQNGKAAESDIFPSLTPVTRRTTRRSTSSSVKDRILRTYQKGQHQEQKLQTPLLGIDQRGTNKVENPITPPIHHPTRTEQNAPLQTNSLMEKKLSNTLGKQRVQGQNVNQKPLVEVIPTVKTPVASNSDIVRTLSVSVPVGSTASTRYMNRTEVPSQKPVFRNLDAASQAGISSGTRGTNSSLVQIVKVNSNPKLCNSAHLPTNSTPSDKGTAMTLITEQEEYVEDENYSNTNGGGTADSSGGGSEDAGLSHTMNKRSVGTANLGRSPSADGVTLSSGKVQTLVVLDPRCRETANVTHEGRMIIVMADDDVEDFEEYEVDEVIERPDGAESLHSRVLDDLLSAFMLGCNVAILAADSRSSSVSSFVLKSVVHDVLAEIQEASTLQPKSKYKGALSVSIVQVRGETVVDLLKENSKPQKLVIAISPIFGPCVHNVNRLPVDSAVAFDSILTSSLTRAAEKEREYGLTFISLVLKQKLEDENDVMVSSLVVSLVGENVGLYAAVLDRSPLIPRALFHYALGGPCFTLALLGFSSDEARANEMLAVQRRLGEMTNRPTHRGSINKFISGIRTDLAPNLREKLGNAEEGESTVRILRCLEEMVRDAEGLLENFDENNPKAYLNEEENHQSGENSTERKPPVVTCTPDNAGEKVRSLVCFEQRLLGNGSIGIQGNSVLSLNGEFVCRFDVDEVMVRSPSGAVPTSELINNLVSKFLLGHNTALLAADSRNCAVTPLILRRIVHLIVCNMKMETPETNVIQGDLLVSIALIKDDVTVDLLTIDEELAFHRFEVDVSPLFNRTLRGVSRHLVASPEGFDHLLAVAVDRAEPALQSDDPGVMVFSLSLAQHVQSPQPDVLLSSFMATTVFDGVSHYTGILRNSPNEPTELFKLALGGPCYTIAMLGLSDEDDDAGHLLMVQMELSHVRNRPSRPTSVVQHVGELKRGIATLSELYKTTKNEQELECIKAKIEQAEVFLRDAISLLEVPVREEAFVPLGSTA